jgi:putative transposase
MGQFTRRIIGFGIKAGDVDGRALCCMFNHAISQQGSPEYLSSDNDPLFPYHQWQANLCILDVEDIKAVPYVLSLSHPFVERLIGTVRRELLDQILFWNVTDLQRKPDSFRDYYNHQRVHKSRDGRPPAETTKHDAAADHFG